MLVLKRRMGETVRIQTPHGEMTITVSRHGSAGDSPPVKLAFDAPREWTILRGELLESDRRKYSKE